MKNQTTTDVRTAAATKPVSPELTRALRESIRSESVSAVLHSAGASTLVGTPVEVLEEVVAYQTAAWLNAPNAWAFNSKAASPAVIDAAAKAIDETVLAEAARPFLTPGSKDVAAIRTNLIHTMAEIAQEAARFAESESRRVSHTCVAVGALIVARNASPPHAQTPLTH